MSHDQSGSQKVLYVIITGEGFIYSRSLTDKCVKCGLELLYSGVLCADVQT